MGIIALLTLTGLKLIVSHYETEKKAVLTDNCCKEFGIIRHNLELLLQNKNPLPGIIDYQNKIAATVDRLINEDNWPFTPPFDIVAADVAALADHYCNSYGAAWTNVSET